jgi:hypothetical protein
MINSTSQFEESSINHIQKFHGRVYANLKGRSYLLKARTNNPIINFNFIVRRMDLHRIDGSLKSLGTKMVNFIQECPEIRNEKDPHLRYTLIISLLLSLLGSFCKSIGHDDETFKEILQQAVNAYRED